MKVPEDVYAIPLGGVWPRLSNCAKAESLATMEKWADWEEMNRLLAMLKNYEKKPGRNELDRIMVARVREMVEADLEKTNPKTKNRKKKS